MRKFQILLLGTALALGACRGAPDAGSALQKAEDYYAKGDFAAARVEILNAIKADPKNVQVYLLNAKNALKLGDGIVAERAVVLAKQNGATAEQTDTLLYRSWLQQMLPLKVLDAIGREAGDKETADTYLLRGEAYQAIERQDKAEEQWAEGLEHFPDNAELLVNNARLKYQEDDMAGASALAARATTADPDSYDVMLLNADLALFKNEPATALPLFEKLAAAYPKDLRVKMGQATALQKSGKEKEALVVAEAVLKEDPKDPVAIMMKAGALEKQGKYAEALKLVESTVVFIRDSALAFKLRGEVAASKGLSDSAISEFRKAVQSEPDNQRYRDRLAKELEKNGETAEAAAVRADAPKAAINVAAE